MKFLLGFVVTAICLLAGVGVHTLGETALKAHKTCTQGPDLQREVFDPYVEVNAPDGSIGSGVYIGNGRVLTAAHVVAGGLAYNVVKRGSLGGVRTTWEAAFVYESRGHDLALLKLYEPTGLQAARLDPELVLHAGEPAWYVGTPYGLHRSLERTIINDPARMVDGQLFVMVNGNATHGNSGGPLYVERDGHFVLAGICSQFAFHPKANGAPICFVGPDACYITIARVR